MHYGGDDGTDADNQEDQKLPFHSCNIHGNSTAYSAILKIVPTSQGVDDNDIKFFNLFIPANSPSGFFDLVKQPPRFS